MKKIRRVVTHPRAHLDELAAYWACVKFGGVVRGEIAFSSNPQQVDGDLLIGTGFGPCDEHRRDGTRKDTCAFALTLNLLKVPSISFLHRLKEEVCVIDNRGGATPSHLENIIKMLYRVGWTDSAVAEFVYTAIDAVYQRGVGQKKQGRALYAELGLPLCGESFTRFLKASNGRAHQLHFELVNILLALRECRGNHLMLGVFNALKSAFADDSLLYEEAVQLIRIAPYREVSGEGSAGELYTAVLVESSNPHCIRAYRSVATGTNGFLVQRNPETGHVCISVDRRSLPESIASLRRLRAMLVVTEYTHHDGVRFTRAQFEELLKENTGDRWYLHDTPGWLFNGSHSHPEVKPTRLKIQTIEDTLVASFSGEGYTKWRERFLIEKRVHREIPKSPILLHLMQAPLEDQLFPQQQQRL